MRVSRTIPTVSRPARRSRPSNALKAAGVSRVDVVGIAESHCVKDTALDAKKLGFEVTVFEDLTVPVSEELGVAARKQMAAGGITLAESR